MQVGRIIDASRYTYRPVLTAEPMLVGHSAVRVAQDRTVVCRDFVQPRRDDSLPRLQALSAISAGLAVLPSAVGCREFLQATNGSSANALMMLSPAVGPGFAIIFCGKQLGVGT
jgi:hypothetical protein